MILKWELFVLNLYTNRNISDYINDFDEVKGKSCLLEAKIWKIIINAGLNITMKIYLHCLM